ncbi:MAG TPA: indolepyruvate ferredoxin oxidoreductase subunit alpha [Bacillota bacterium]|nr:indolepyruvate ferredoxin oxidoreductase subunit alpha [Bacillota bacterium]HNT03640.1 indolepyruvate ferredoxin oxidoreductase subunit alpha [Bacillota bacterium]HPA54576.1 indolepyruvate ferredoxin oxidoreductase subunit alpha [Bacillota bacterium]HPX69312.1 indolepyruvate ferredoxin oxidoreductase subunit alpha [Bacillota bacterium]HQA65760.1 indolepyruvate ferredoxin oxidoreductase subunit alpha [Bacillota bacterium]
MKQLMSGNEAIARGAYEAGVKVAAAYPGTPSTEILENIVEYKDDIYCEWAPNEKVATEVAIGASIAGVRSISAMKHVGLNVAADPIFTYAYLGVNAGYVLITADDPSMHSSQNEQDNRYYAKFAKIPMVEPSDSQESKDFMAEAFKISEQFDTPVLYRVTTRVCHSKSMVEFGERIEVEPKSYERNAAKYVATPANAKIARIKVEERMKSLEEYAYSSPLNKIEYNKDTKIGIITAGISYQYVKEVFGDNASYLKLGFTFPLPMKLIKEFASKFETVYVVEELDPFMEEQIKAEGVKCIGKELIPPMYELNPDIVAKALLNKENETKKVDAKVVGRPPVLCPGCPHRGFFYTMSKKKNTVVTSDIGCYTLGGSPPLNAVDTCICMGAGFSAGMGMAKAFEASGRDNKVFGVVGDSTFFHSGITGAIDIVYNKGKMVPVVLDNRITGMTGHQENPGTGKTLMGEDAVQIDPVEVLRAIGYKTVKTVDPCDLKAMDEVVTEAVNSEEPYAIVTKRPCVLIKGLPPFKTKCRVDRDKCKKCKMCLKVGCPAVFFKDGTSYIDQSMCVGCEVCMQVCKFDAIEKVGE